MENVDNTCKIPSVFLSKSDRNPLECNKQEYFYRYCLLVTEDIHYRSYCVDIFQLVRFPRGFNNVFDFNESHLCIIKKINTPVFSMSQNNK